VQGPSETRDSVYRLILANKKEESFAGHLFHYSTEEDQHIRIKDGLPSQRTTVWNREGDPGHTKLSMKLISAE
jgi:hypothetical protein